MKKRYQVAGSGREKEKSLCYAELLERTKWANEFSWEQICTIARSIKAVKAKQDRVIFREGDLEKSMGIIVAGAIDIYKQGDRGMKKITTLHMSQTFGEMALVDDEPRSATGIANQSSVIFFLTRARLVAIADENPSLGFKLLWKISKIISQRLRSTTGKLVEHM
ncbi:MAG: cyclic nucleotide-binding domain-containing protein [Desulfobacteraceae bacterium]